MAVVRSSTGSPHGFAGVLQHAERLSPADRLKLVQSLSEHVVSLHRVGRLHLQIDTATIKQLPAVGSVLSVPAPQRRWPRDSSAIASLPRELHTRLPLELSTELAVAERQLHTSGEPFDPRQIDLYQFGTLLGALVANAGPEEYLRGVRVKQRVPAVFRPLLERAWGFDGKHRFRDLAEFCDELKLVCRSPLIPKDVASRWHRHNKSAYGTWICNSYG